MISATVCPEMVMPQNHSAGFDKNAIKGVYSCVILV